MSAKPPVISPISPEQIEKIKSADLKNIISKVKAGKTLSALERKIIDGYAGIEMPEDGELVTTSRLADIFGINRKTIPEWRKEGKDVPEKIKGREPLTAWRAWFAANPDAGYSDRKPRQDRESLMCENIELRNKILNIEYEVAEKKLIPIAQARESVRRIITATRGEFLKLSNDLPPKLSGLSESKMKGIITSSLHRILESLSSELRKPYDETLSDT
jgi:hypothetical protein